MMIKGKNIVIPQWIAGVATTMLTAQLGFMAGSASPMLAKLTAPDSPLHLGPDEASWVASLANIGRFLGAVVGSILVSYIGSKKTITITLIPIAFGWLGIALAWNIEIMYAARVSIGIGVGMTNSTFSLYLGEIAMANIRGALVSIGSCGLAIGQVIASAATAHLDLSTSFYMYFGCTTLLMLLFCYLPESPHHLVKIDKIEAARESINWYRCGIEVDEELKAVEKFVISERSISFTDRLREFKKPGIRKATFQVIALFTFLQICGLNSFIFYMEIIFVRAKVTVINAADVVIYVNICAVLASFTSVFLIDRFGRRFLLLVSSIGVSISMFAMMSHFILIDKNVDVTHLQWLPILSMVLYMLTFYVGLSPVPPTVLSETFPANVKCIAATIASFSAGITSFSSTKTFQPFINLMGEAYVFMLYAIFAILVIPYTIFIMPETKGKSLQQIQDDMVKEK